MLSVQTLALVNEANRAALAGLPDIDALVGLANAADVASLSALAAVIDLDGLELPISVLLRAALKVRDTVDAPIEIHPAHRAFSHISLRHPLS
jgi:hypothetical protein